MTTPSYLDHILNGAMVLDEQCCVLFWNHWLEIQTGIKRSEITGRPIFEFFPDINQKLIQRKLKQIFALNTPAFITAEAEKYLIKIPTRKISDKIFDYMLQNVVISVYEKESRYSLFMIYDQTSLFEAKVRLETNAKVLEEQKSLLQNTIDFQSNILFVIDKTNIISCNNNFLELFGYDIVQKINSGSSDLLSFVTIEKNPEFENIFPSFYGFIEDSLRRNRINKLSVIDASQRETIFLFSARKMPDSDRIIVSMTDITLLQNREKVLQDINLELGRRFDEKNIELKKLNFDLARSRDQLQLAQEVANVGSFEYICSDGSIHLSNGLRTIFDNPSITVLTLDEILAYFKPEFRQKLDKMIDNASSGGQDFSAYAEIVSETGAQKPIGVHCRVFGGQGEDSRRLIITLNDLSNVKELEKQIQDKEQLLIQQSKMAAMGEMIGVIGHQWKQPLNAISLILDGIRCDHEEGTLEPDMLDRRVDTCFEQIQFMAETIDDFRSFFNPDTNIGVFDLTEAVGNTVRILTPLFEKNGTKIAVESEPPYGIYVRGIANEFRHTVMNLMTNSKDAIVARIQNDEKIKGLVRIGINSDGQNVTISVCDNGGGIPEKHMEHIFKPYFTTKGSKGTGIGMYLAHIIISKKMNGTIFAENTGDGACVRIILPIAERA